MKATGIIRRIDDLGRVVVPKEIRRTLRLKEGDPLEIYTDNDGGIVFKKYAPLGELETLAAQYAEALYGNSGCAVIVCDRDQVIAVAGVPKRDLLERRVSVALDDYMEQRETYLYRGNGHDRLQPVEGVDRFSIASAPIIASNDVYGSVTLLATGDTSTAGDTEIKLVNTAAAFLGKQMEA